MWIGFLEQIINDTMQNDIVALKCFTSNITSMKLKSGYREEQILLFILVTQLFNKRIK